MAETTRTGGREGGRKQARAEPGKRARAEPKGRATRAEPAAGSQQPPHVCPVAFCPIGAALSVAQGAGPDVLEHLLAAAREFLLAVKALVEARSADFEGKGEARAPLTRIEIG